MKNSQLAALALFSLALLLLAGLDPWSAAEPPPLGRVLSANELSSLTTIEISRESRATIRIEKREGGPWQLADTEAPLDLAATRELVGALRLLRVSRKAPRLPAHGLAKTSELLTLGLASGPMHISFGQTSSDGRHQWVGIRDQKTSLLVEAHLLREIVAASERLESRKLLPSRPSAEDQLRLRGPNGSIEISAGTMQWSGYAGELPRVDAQRFAQLRDRLAALRFVEAAGEQAPCTGGRNYEIRYARHDLRIRECGACDSEGVKVSMGARTGCVATEDWSALTEAIDQPLELLDLSFLGGHEPPESLSIQCGESVLQVEKAEVDERRLAQWWRAVSLGAREILMGPAPKAQCTISAAGRQVQVGKFGESWFAYRGDAYPVGNQTEGGGVPSDRILWWLRAGVGEQLRAERSLFLSLDLIAEEPLQATHIRIVQGRLDVKLERGELVNHWHDQGGSLNELAASEWALALRGALAGLRAETYAPGTESKGALRTLMIDFSRPGAAQAAHYKVQVTPLNSAKGAAPNACSVTVNELPAARISGADCRALLMPTP